MVPPNESNTTTDAISGFLQAIRSSCILSERQLEKLEANMAEGEYPSEPAELASRLVKDGILTEYQARQILKGKPQGLIFGSYVILDFLGKGTMGKVYKARHRMMGRVVALKILDSRYVASSTRSLARFQREMQLVGRLDHPNVVRAFDADRVGDCYFIAMEYAAGLTLEDLLKARGALPPADVVYYASQAADGLAHAHARGVLHRDIKPSNLLLTEGRKLKILDFGLGTLLEKEELPTALTTAGIAVGTPDYISPEQARMVKIDGRSDLYSLGCTMYHLLSGQLPFKGESSMDCIVGRITGQAVPISEVRPGLPPRLVQSIEKLMATNPDDRYQTADEAAAALRSLLRPKNAPPGRSAPTVAATAPVPGRPTPRTRPAVTPYPNRPRNANYRGPFATRPGRGSLVETEAGFAPVTLDRSRDEDQASSRRGRSRGGLTDRRHDHALQVIEGRTSGIPAGGLDTRTTAPSSRRAGQKFASRVRRSKARSQRRRSSEGEPRPSPGGWGRSSPVGSGDRKPEARGDGRYERGPHRADRIQGMAGDLRPGGHPRPAVVVPGPRRKGRRREVQHEGRLR